uniref:Acyl-CoA thioester hydrolase/bile acid-CoA amino acid N-acetyltransferase domain-containing protein n=1 Tax=Branchiostoma floridae TaxID=7739 RepID=C4A0E2_BRAFL|eukprot:XP_002585734.1 hypothetical protein BRAFLDRAFT_72249 [Branchiostoma floridae]
MSSQARLLVTPATALVDDKVDITVERLAPRQPVTLHARLLEGTARFQSYAHYRADDTGRVVVAKQPSLGGLYTGVDQMGLFWSMQPSPGQKPGLRLRKKDVSTPFLVDLSVHDGHLDMMEEQNPAALVTTRLERWYLGKGVKRIPLREGRLRGALFLPPGEGPFPGVIDMFGSTGGFADYRSALLASRGFATLGTEAADWLLGHPKVQNHGVGLVGTSKAGEIVLAMATYMKQLSDPSAVDTYLSVEKSHCPIMFVTGEDDMNIPSVFHANKAIARMKAHGKTNYTLLKYPGTGHLIEPPYTPHCGFYFHPAFRVYVYAGGESKAHTAAQEDSWSKILDFLRKNVDKCETRSKL